MPAGTRRAEEWGRPGGWLGGRLPLTATLVTLLGVASAILFSIFSAGPANRPTATASAGSRQSELAGRLLQPQPLPTRAWAEIWSAPIDVAAAASVEASPVEAGGSTTSPSAAQAPAAVAAPAVPTCVFERGFKALQQQLPAVVGECLENERFDPVRGQSVQRTTRGTLIWDKATNRSAFTDGKTTWRLGPRGVEQGPAN